MKFQNIKRNTLLLFLLAILIFSSCAENETESLFDEDTSARTEKSINELRELLKSSTDGWRAIYFPDDSRFGGFTFNFRFKDDRNVEMVSDLSTSITPVESEYDVRFGATTSLVFTSKGLIHDLVNNTTQGDLEFLYYGRDGEDILFRSNRTNREVRFTKATASDWTTIAQHENLRVNFGSSPFGKLIVDGTSYGYGYGNSTRFLSTDDGTYKFGVGLTPNTLIISPAIEVNGETISEFTYVSADNKFVAEIGGVEVASFVFFNTPQDVLPFYDYSNELDDFRLMRTRESIIADDRSTVAFIEFFEQWRADVSNALGGGFVISHVYLWDTDVEPYLNIRLTRLSDGATFNSRYFFTNVRTTDALGNIIETFTFDPTNPDNSDVGIPTLLQPFVDFFFSPGGFYIKDSIPYPLNSSQNTAIFISVDDPSMAMHWYDF